jgi:acetyltransferase-like isoleucine patch superfamily enzyme
MIVGTHVLIANNVAFIGRYDHIPWQIGSSTADSISVRYEDLPIPLGGGRIDIGDDVWVGFDTIVYSDVRIGEGSVVAAGSIAIRDVPPFTIVTEDCHKNIRSFLCDSRFGLFD